MSRNNSKSKKNKGDKQVKKVKAGTYTFARGKICFIGKGIAVGSEQAGDRPAIIFSSDEQNRSSREVEVVFLTTKKKNLMPTHVPVDSAPDPSIALCEQIQTVDKWRIKEYLGTATWEEMEKIDQALAISLGLPGAKNGQLSDGVKPGEFRRGQVHHIIDGSTGTKKPVVIVSNNVGNLFSTIVEVVPLSRLEDKDLPSEAAVSLSGKDYTALCGKIQTMDKERLIEYIGTMSGKEMEEISQAMAVGLGLAAEKRSSAPAGKLVQTGSRLAGIPEKECKMPA